MFSPQILISLHLLTKYVSYQTARFQVDISCNTITLFSPTQQPKYFGFGLISLLLGVMVSKKCTLQHIFDHLSQKHKHRKCEFYQNSPMRGKILIFDFSQKILRESTFQHISDHLRPKTKMENCEFFRKFLSPRKVP